MNLKLKLKFRFIAGSFPRTNIGKTTKLIHPQSANFKHEDVQFVDQSVTDSETSSLGKENSSH